MKNFRIILGIGLGFWVISCASHKVDVDKVGGLREAKEIIDVAKDEGAKKYAPAALQSAEDALNHAAEVTYENKDMKAVETETLAAKAQANRALLMTRESKTFDSMEPEDIALWTEAKLNGLRKPLGITPEFQSFDKQFLTVQEAAAQSSELGATAKSLQGKTATLEKDKAFNDKYSQVREKFTEEEATIFRAGNNLIVRLKAMEFPSGKSDIKPESYALLTKLKETVKAFGEPNITIEGHTDSTGSAKKNQELAKQRAESVKEYLVANEAINEENVKVVGVGSSKPVASNQTPEGRAENRRIDAIIAPTQAAE